MTRIQSSRAGTMSTTDIYKIAIYGAGGLTGRELLRLLKHHPALEPAFISSDKYAGTPVDQIFPELSGTYDLPFSRHSDPLPGDIQATLLAVPNQSALDLVPRLMDQQMLTIDLSGSFRLHDQEKFQSYYGLKHSAWDRMDQIVFGLPELFRAQIKSARTISNPGCFPTAPVIALHLLGELRNSLNSIIIDAKSGVSGAGGRTEDSGFAFSGVYENFRAYKILKHQHQPEIEEYAATGLVGGLPCPLVFTPHLLPVERGILTTMVLHWKDSAPADLEERFRKACADEAFLRYREVPEEIELRKVQHTNYVDLAIRSRENITVVVMAIDNLLKGAAGQAIQNLNLMLGQPETSGLL